MRHCLPLAKIPARKGISKSRFPFGIYTFQEITSTDEFRKKLTAGLELTPSFRATFGIESLDSTDQLHGFPVTAGEGLVEACAGDFALGHFRGNVGDDLSGNPNHKFSRGDFPVVGDHAAGTDNAIISDLHSFMKDRSHSHENVFSDPGPMNDGAVADVAVFRQPGGLLGKGVNDHVLLDIGAVSDFDVAEISPQDSSRADVAVFPDGHASDQDRAGVDKRGFADLGSFPLEFVNGHINQPFGRILAVIK
jgi:hypothetical protein